MRIKKKPPTAILEDADGDECAPRIPTYRTQYGHAVVATWPHSVKTRDGTRNTWVTTVARMYFDNDERRYSKNLFPSDLFNAAAALQQHAVELHAELSKTEPEYVWSRTPERKK